MHRRPSGQGKPCFADGAPLPALTLDTARSISETVVLLSMERAPRGGTALAGQAG